MGTSSGHKPPTSGNWGTIKKDLSNIANSVSFPQKKALKVIGDFISAKGGGSTTQSAYGSWTIAPKKVSKGIAGFISDVSLFGFADTLNKQGLGYLIGKSAKNIIAVLIDNFGGDGNTRDEINASRALQSTMDCFMENEDTFENIESIFKHLSNPDLFREFLLTFLGYYIFQQFCSCYEEFLFSKMKNENSEDLIKEIEGAILAAVKNKSLDIDLSKVDWKGGEGDNIMDTIMVKTFRIFGD